MMGVTPELGRGFAIFTLIHPIFATATNII